MDVTRHARTLATAVGVIGLASCASLIAFFVVGGPFGLINDLGNAVLGVFCAALAIARPDGTRGPGRAAAVLGAAVTVLGTLLVISGTTGFFLAGLVSAVGFALIGVWLLTTARGDRLAVIAGAVMLLGFIGSPGIAAGWDDMGSAPVWIQAGGVSWLGTYVLLPVWSLRFGRVRARQALV